MSLPYLSPSEPAHSRAEVFLLYLDFFRESLIAKVAELPEEELRRSRVASGWTPLELVKHLRWVELRWIEWGVEGSHLEHPWGDRRDHRWYVAPDETLDGLVAELRKQGAHTRAVVEVSDLDALAPPGPRWEHEPPATVERILFHLVQEYARHLGHLDIVVEIAGAPTAER